MTTAPVQIVPQVPLAFEPGRRLARRSIWVRSRTLLAGAVLAPAVLLAVIFESAPVPGSWLQVASAQLGWALIVGGVMLRLWATLYIGGRKSKRLVTEGPYSLVRNPLYLGTLLAVCGACLAWQSLVMFAALLVALPLYTRLTIRDEERRLRHHWGAQYDHYAASVPRLWPRWQWPASPAVVEVHVAGLLRELARAALWLTALPLAAALTPWLRAAGRALLSLG
ncbi:MAG: isoprenylcysteine carboxylmethyltransferase family protein [Pirellulales bacterium]|nr:isoprenylcysteine carboxylmethyltransferase family protein [Pirellulales bacterium]